MPLISRLLGIWAVGKTVSSTTPLFMRLIAGMAALTLFAVFAAVILATLLGMLVWFGYSEMIAQGMLRYHAVMLISAVLLALLCMLFVVIQHYWQKANRIVRNILYMQSPIQGRLGQLSDAFMSGFNR